ncbi:MAG: methyl-accepting chemotaxis protein, partial [Candidatus Zixiibacteriota bacterium]
HLNWANQVSALLTDDEVTELKVQTDPHKCAFGSWYYSDNRKHAEELFPELIPIFAEIELPHKNLHESAIEISKHYQKADEELGRFLEAKKGDHLRWINAVKDAFINNNDGIDVQMDPAKCGLGQWLESPEVAELKLQYPEFAANLAKIEEPHSRLHESAKEINKMLKEKKHSEAVNYFSENTENDARNTLNAIENVIVWNQKHIEGINEANKIFANKTKPNLKEVQSLLSKVNETVEKNVKIKNEQMLQASGNTKTLVTVIAVSALLIGIFLAITIARGIIKTMVAIIGNLSAGSEQVGAASEQVAGASQSLAEGASETASSLEETSSSLEEMTSMIRQNADNTKQANSLVLAASDETDKGMTAMNSMSEAMNQIKNSSDETAKIIKVIDEIAFQTNLLALNAAVEAARAGEAGKGFAVVAEEVRNLAQRSAESAKDTSSLIEGSQKNAEAGVKSTQELVEILKNISEGIRKITDLMAEITAASNEQAQGIDQINTAVSQMDQVTQQNASNAEESSSASEELASQAQEMQKIVNELSLVIYGTNGKNIQTQFNENNFGRQATTTSKSSGYNKNPNKIAGWKKKIGRTVNPNKAALKAEEIIPLEKEEMANF